MRTARDTLVFLSFAAPIVAASFLLGGVYTATTYNLIVMRIVACLFFAWAVWLSVSGRRLFVPLLVVPLLLIMGWALLHLLPLPPAIVGLLSPTARYFHAMAGPEGWRPLTMSSPDTLYSIMRTATLVLFILMLQRTIEVERRGWRRLVTDTIVVTAALLFAFGVFLKLTGVETFLGSTLRGPLLMHPTFINLNHAAAFFGVASLLSLATAVEADLARARVFYGALFFVNLLAVVMTLSRGGILAVVCAMVFFFALKLFKERTRVLLLPVLFSLVAVATAFYVGYNLIVAEFDLSRPDYFDKFLLLTTVGDYLADFWRVGSGLGSFMHVYPYYQGDPGLFFIQLENEPVQFALEHGLPFALIVAALIVWFFVKYNRREHCRCGAAAILLFILMHNTLDFNLHDLAILFPVAAVYLMASGSFELKGWPRRLALGAGMLAALGLLWGSRYGDDLDFYRAKDMLPYDTLVRRYPADFKVPLRDALARYNDGRRERFLAALPFLSEAAAKAPDYYHISYLTGSALLRLGSIEEGILLYVKAVDRAPERHLGRLLGDIYRHLGAAGIEPRMRELLPFGRPGARETVSRFLASVRSPELVGSFIAGREEEFFETAGQLYLSTGDTARLTDLLDRVSALAGDWPVARRGRYLMLRGQAALRRKDPATALSLFRQGAALTGAFDDVLTLAQATLSHEPDRCGELDAMLQEKALTDKGRLARYHRWKSDWLWRRGEMRESLKYLQRGADIGGYPQWRIDGARRLASQGLWEEAVAELTHLKDSRKQVDVAAVDALIEEYRRRMERKRSGLMQEMLLEKR
ncbi:MAG TPA: hypothetical protein PKH10_05535 [bacterium]|nr:hypothetical protein [bacterium]